MPHFSTEDLKILAKLERDFVEFIDSNPKKASSREQEAIQFIQNNNRIRLEDIAVELSRSKLRRTTMGIIRKITNIKLRGSETHDTTQSKRLLKENLFRALSDEFCLLARCYAPADQKNLFAVIDADIMIVTEKSLINSVIMEPQHYALQLLITHRLGETLSDTKAKELTAIKLPTYLCRVDELPHVEVGIQMLSEHIGTQRDDTAFKLSLKLALECQELSERLHYERCIATLTPRIEDYLVQLKNQVFEEERNSMIVDLAACKARVDIFTQGLFAYTQRSMHLSHHYQPFVREFITLNGQLLHYEIDFMLYERQKSLLNPDDPRNRRRQAAADLYLGQDDIIELRPSSPELLEQILSNEAKTFAQLSQAYDRLALLHKTKAPNDIRRQSSLSAKACLLWLQMSVNEHLSANAHYQQRAHQHPHGKPPVSAPELSELRSVTESLGYEQPANLTNYLEGLITYRERLQEPHWSNALDHAGKLEGLINLTMVTAKLVSSLQFSCTPKKSEAKTYFEKYLKHYQDALALCHTPADREKCKEKLVVLSPSVLNLDFNNTCGKFHLAVLDSINPFKPVEQIENLTEFCRIISEAHALNDCLNLPTLFDNIIGQYLSGLEHSTVEIWYQHLSRAEMVKFLNDLTQICAKPELMPDNEAPKHDDVLSILANTKVLFSVLIKRIQTHLILKDMAPQLQPLLLDERQLMFGVNLTLSEKMKSALNTMVKNTNRFHFLNPPKKPDIVEPDPASSARARSEPIPHRKPIIEDEDLVDIPLI